MVQRCVTTRSVTTWYTETNDGQFSNGLNAEMIRLDSETIIKRPIPAPYLYIIIIDDYKTAHPRPLPTPPSQVRADRRRGPGRMASAAVVWVTAAWGASMPWLLWRTGRERPLHPSPPRRPPDGKDVVCRVSKTRPDSEKHTGELEAFNRPTGTRVGCACWKQKCFLNPLSPSWHRDKSRFSSGKMTWMRRCHAAG